MYKIYNEINFIEKEILKVSLWHQENDINSLAKLYSRIQKTKKELFNTIPLADYFDLYCDLKFKLYEDEINTKILIKEKLGLDTQEDYLELKKLIS